MKVLVYATGKQGTQEGSSIEEARQRIEEGHDVMYLHCGKTIGGCLENPLFNQGICKYCQFFQEKRALKYLPSKNVFCVNNFYTDEIKNKIDSIDFSIDSPKQVRSIKYRGVDIGYGAFSTYISLTRNMDPLITEEVELYLKSLLIQQVVLIEILYSIFEKFYPDQIVFHNGRFAQYKPLVGISMVEGIKFICTEVFLKQDGYALKNNFDNAIPHNYHARTILYEKFWNDYPDKNERIKVGKSFFENRRYGKFAGDKIYVKDQHYGELPDSWDEKKENIVFFNSSEDEYCSISKEVDDFAMFESQLVGIKKILDHYKEDKHKHFYLRIHPNLKDIPYSYHKDLYKLKYPNLTVIPGNSTISSYALLDKANKVIVFGSTMGIEASYWGKPVICLAYALYAELDVVYIPKSIHELWTLIDKEPLPAKITDKSLMFGLYYMAGSGEKFKYIENGFYRYSIRGKVYQIPRYCKMLGSSFLYMLIESILRRSCSVLFKNKFSSVPV